MILIRFNASVLACIALLGLASAGQPAEPTKIPIRFATPGKGHLSLGVYDDSGTLIRSLTYASEVGGGKQTLEWDGTAVPLKSLELDPPRNPTVGFDASVGFPDVGGRVRASAAHWAGQSEAAVVDRPGSAALLPRRGARSCSTGGR